MVLTVGHGPNFAPPGTSKPNRKRPTNGKSVSGSKIGQPILHLVGKFILPRSLDERPFFPSKPINCDTSPDLSSSNRYRAINVAVISTRNLSAQVNQKPRSCISSHADFTGDRLRYVVNLCVTYAYLACLNGD